MALMFITVSDRVSYDLVTHYRQNGGSMKYAQSQFVLYTSFVFYTFPINYRNFKKVVGLGLGLILVSTVSTVLICVRVCTIFQILLMCPQKNGEV